MYIQCITYLSDETARSAQKKHSFKGEMTGSNEGLGEDDFLPCLVSTEECEALGRIHSRGQVLCVSHMPVGMIGGQQEESGYTPPIGVRLTSFLCSVHSPVCSAGSRLPLELDRSAFGAGSKAETVWLEQVHELSVILTGHSHTLTLRGFLATKKM